MSAGIGVVVPYDFALDRELWRWVPEGADLHLTRTPFVALPVGTDQAWAISDASVVACGVHDLVAVEPHVVAYGCTSGSFVGGLAGEKWLCETMVAAGAPVAVTPSGALVSGSSDQAPSCPETHSATIAPYAATSSAKYS